MGSILGILAISIGLSFFEDSLNFSKEMSGGDSSVSETLLYKSETNMDSLDSILKTLNEDYRVSVGSITYPIDTTS